MKELSTWFRTRFQCQAISILDELQKRHLISYLFLDRGKVVKYKMTVSCGEDKPVYTFELTLSPTEKDREGGAKPI